MIHIGFTGTRLTLDDRQTAWLKDELVMLDLHIRLVRLQKPVLHHGDCVGADATAHALARHLGWDIHIHPPLDQSRRAFCKGAQKTHEPLKYLARNRRIVRACPTLLAVPGTPLQLRDDGSVAGGTWYTTLYALRRGREVKICSVN